MEPIVKKMAAAVLRSSEFLSAVRAVSRGPQSSRLFGNAVRPLTTAEISSLEKQGNVCSRWDAIRVAKKFDPKFVSGSRFLGACVIGSFESGKMAVERGLSLPAGICNSIISDSEIGTNCLICDATVSHCLVGAEAVVFSVGALVCDGRTSFGNGRPIQVGIEAGGREILGFADLTISIAEAMSFGATRTARAADYARFVKEYVRRCTLPFTVIGPRSVVRRAVAVRNSFLCTGCVVDGAALVENVTALCSQDQAAFVGHGAIVKNSCLQWGCSVSSHAVVENSILTEASSVEGHALVTASVLGPNTHVAKGEVTCSLLGPFVGFHHQAMLIGVLWPDGKGNVASGANIGSNHTSRAPDQELLCGEGIFFGLGASVKYPANLLRAPYTLIATGVTLPPQLLEFPFSLVNCSQGRSESMPSYLNELLPSWVLSDNLYAVLRSERKFLSRNNAKHTPLDTAVFRATIIDMMVAARDRLAGITQARAWYDSSHIAGAGANFISETNRRSAIETYNFFIELYCLRGLALRLACAPPSGVFVRRTPDPLWEHRRLLLRREGFSARDVRTNLLRLIDMEDAVVRSALMAKKKDDARGRIIIDDYDSAHVSADKDPFVLDIKAAAGRVKAEIRSAISRL